MQDDMNPDDAGQTEAPGPEPAAQQEPGKPSEQTQSRKAVWLAMGAVALALGLIWVAPGIEPHVDESAPGRLPIIRASPMTLRQLANPRSWISPSRTCTAWMCTWNRSRGRSSW